MNWSIHLGDILDVPADVLVCSANVYLTLSGGVGGAFSLRYGPAMQESRNEYLRQRNSRHVPRGTVVAMPPCGSPYQAVLHAVAVDGLYGSSPEIVDALITDSLRQAASLQARSVALAALATGYGRLTMADFSQALRSIIDREILPVERIVIGLRSRSDVEELLELDPKLTLASTDPDQRCPATD